MNYASSVLLCLQFEERFRTFPFSLLVVWSMRFHKNALVWTKPYSILSYVNDKSPHVIFFFGACFTLKFLASNVLRENSIYFHCLPWALHSRPKTTFRSASNTLHLIRVSKGTIQVPRVVQVVRQDSPLLRVVCMAAVDSSLFTRFSSLVYLPGTN